ncbi:MAG: non-ribosomal peptide synthetase, partial [Akkermansiaceae bacterium]|nr:non-ribosomal peptide synthetase [Verrucomicrobiales bacterium]
RANQLAHRLTKLGVKADTLVGLCLDRSPEMIVALLAILKVGGAYVPFDRQYPKERLQFMREDSEVELLITTGDWKVASIGRLESLPYNQQPASTSPKILQLDRESGLALEPTGNLQTTATAESLAYVIYTSGSTGTPKGAAIPHRAVVRLVRHTNYVTFSSSDVFLQLAPISFDASTFEIWGALLNGATLVLFPPHVPSLEELGRTIETQRITTLWLTAGLFHQMVDHQLASLRGVRQLLAGGDVLSVPHVLKMLRQLPGCQLINGYGPTENTTFTCCHRIPADWTGGRSVPIGRPISNTQVYVLDPNQTPVPAGVPGELFTGGDGLARGYLNRPELNREKFLIRDQRLYRTGDKVRWLPEGHLEFLGRMDQQVKIRGFRVEPGEIEATLAQHPAVREAAVVVRETVGQDRQLVAYVTLQNAALFDAPNLRDHLAAKLPSHMIPAHFVSLPVLPLTPNGKLDARALPAPELDGAQAGAGITSPRDAAEETLCQIWRELLGRNSFGIHDNFFQLGGHSLLVTQMISRIARAFQVELPVRSVFEAPTVAALSEKIQQTAPARSNASAITRRKTSRAEARELLTRIDEFSQAEIESLLARPK